VKSPPRQLWPPQWYYFSLQGMTWRKNKVSKIKKILPYEIKFLLPNYSCLQNPWLGGYRPQIPVLSVLCPQLNLLNPHRTKFLGTPLAIDYGNLSHFFHRQRRRSASKIKDYYLPELRLKIQSVPRSKHSVQVIKTSQLMLHIFNNAASSEIYTKHINTCSTVSFG
jgi:hypothetical protein